jgi:ERCC4-related helicase
MSGRLKPRPYQLDAAAEAISRNTVINIRTGGGKTLIAAVVIDTFIKSSHKLVCFIVPSRALVSQQASYLRRNCQQKQGKELRVAGNVFTTTLVFLCDAANYSDSSPQLWNMSSSIPHATVFTFVGIFFSVITF